MKKTPKQPDLTILIPAYREAKRIGKTLDALAAYLQSEPTLASKAVEVVVVSADSPDKTHQIAESKEHLFKDFRLLKPGPKVGKGRDVQYGMLHAKGKAVLFMDADMATPLANIATFYQAFLDGADVVVATRNMQKHHPGMFRRTVSNMGNLLFRVLGGVWIEDSQCGFKLFSDKAAQACFSRLSILGWGFDMEVLTIAKIHGFTMAIFRIDDWAHQPDGTFEEDVLKNSLSGLVDLARIFRRRLTRQYSK